MDILPESTDFVSDVLRQWGDRSAGIQVNQELNLKGKVCPYTFVESMLALEEMEIGQVLRVLWTTPHPPVTCRKV